MANLDKNMAEVQQHLEPNEKVMASVLGTYEAKRLGVDMVRNGVLVATDRRLLFYAKKLTGYEMETFPYSNISSFESGKNFMGHTITLFASGNQAQVKWIKDVEGFNAIVGYVKPRIGHKEAAPAPAAAPAAEDPLQRLKMRMVNGEITPAQYEEMKKILTG